jgi:hypothetical protein
MRRLSAYRGRRQTVAPKRPRLAKTAIQLTVQGDAVDPFCGHPAL